MPSSEKLWRKPPQDKTTERVVREDISDEVTFKQGLKEVSHLGI